jgi:VanZ family protein
MLVPLGFLVTSALSPRRASALRPVAWLASLVLCAAAILGIKYLQLFFPPRTVTLNYVTAQTVGAFCGCVASIVWQDRVAAPARRGDPVLGLVIGLRLYLAALVVFVLMPLDFALDRADMQAMLDRLPATLTTVPGPGRPLPVRAAMLIAAGLAFVPVGMLLTFVKIGVFRVRRGLWAVLGRGLLLTTALYAVSTLVMGAWPALISIAYRSAGILVGAVSLHWLVRQDLQALRQRLARIVPWTTLPYLVALMVVNGLVSAHWRTPERALAETYPLGFLPLFDYYIVSKAEAAKNIAAHALMYMPIGVAVWLRSAPRAGGGLAFALAALLSFGVETGRYLRPGLEGDINAVAVAGLSAYLAAQLMPSFWSWLEVVVRQSAAAPHRRWNLRRPRIAAASPASQGDNSKGSVEYL